MILRRVLSRGLKAGMGRMAKGDGQGPQSKRARQTARRARKAARLMRRNGRL
ncbi:hypothetical protein OB2597_02397 [Pseudooceanicola batsensis HTCC2597]|uniref:Uncharacterized protein n=1 Tax=Pseudooceanicola batsensis (strain ATCC BAA-863 / DSM 15984 / KCTC 12145 / HTCC2597) TaxID=252305 RepID=A3TX73_PSEBH|nr:hypothetical protein OB2597_02397 [Pseudooceanicola batsensis HTCC2597]